MSSSPTTKTVQALLELHFYSLAPNNKQTLVLYKKPTASQTPMRGKRKNNKKQRNNSQFTTVTAPIARTQIYRYVAPKMRSSGSDFVVTHTQKFFDVVGTGTAAVSSGLPLNPGRDIFIWLSNIAPNYERFQWNSLQFLYKPTCSTTTAGKLIMAIDYDPNDAGISNPDTLEFWKGTAVTVPWKELTMTADLAGLHARKTYLVAPSTGGYGGDIALYLPGNFYLGQVGVTEDLVAGTVYMKYSVTFSSPQIADIPP